MKTLPIRSPRGEHGVTIIELLVALAVFALFILMIDAVFSGARTNARKTEVAADVQQNVRSAVYRITRELRETDAAQIVTGTDSNGQGQLVFKSARLVADNTVYCLYTKVGSGLGFDARCWTSFGGTFSSAQPPLAGYSGTPPSPCNATDVPCATYSPLWQQYIGYYVQGQPGGGPPYTLYRVYGQLTPLPNQTPVTTMLSGGDVIASNVQSFGNIAISGGIVSVSIQGLGNPIVQGKALPAQQIALPSQSMMRN